MRICILAKHIPPKVTDGIARNRWLYAKMFQRYGWEVHIITSGVEGVEEYKEGIYIHEIAIEDIQFRTPILDHAGEADADLKHMLNYSYAAYKRLKKLHRLFPVDVIDTSLWGLEGLVSRIKLPDVPMITRVDTTSRLLFEINHPGKTNEFSSTNQLEQFLLLHSEGLVFNSWSILRETERLYESDFTGKQYAIIHHGLDVEEIEIEEEQSQNEAGIFRVVIPGRLERRKGTPIMIESILPGLLNGQKNVEVHFVGKDNSDWDGFKGETGNSYTELIEQKFRKDIGKRLFLHGYVNDEALHALYEQADCVLTPSLYESLGLVYLEAAMYGKPLLALRAGALEELFEHEKEVLMADPDQPQEICEFILRLNQDRSFGRQLGKNARLKMNSHFKASIMVQKCANFIKTILNQRRSGTIYQLMNSLTVGDGVSTFTRDYDYMFKVHGLPAQIMGNHSSEQLHQLTKQIHEFSFNESDTIVYHYCGHCEWAEYMNTIDAPPKVLLFHNITPPEFFKETSSEYQSAINGLRQTPILDNFDLYVTLSQYSLNILQQLIPRKLNAFIMPQLIDSELIMAKPFDEELVASLKKKHPFHIIFVGRVVPHKKQMDIVKFAAWFKKHHNVPFHISLIGGGMESYFQELNEFIAHSGLQDHITITRKVPDDKLYSYYRAADAYLSMSEHEGFGTPLAEAMVFGIPVSAYGVTAIPETIGDNDCIFYEKNNAVIGEIMHRLYADKEFRNAVIAKQNVQLRKYSKENVWKALEQMLDKARELYAERRNRLSAQNRLFSEEFLNYKSPHLLRRGEWRFADGRTLINYGNDKESYLELNISFYEVDIFLINNSHSGRVAIYLNNKEVHNINLYSKQWHVKGYRVKSHYGEAVHNLKIIPLCEKSGQSTGKEVLIYGILVKKRYISISGSDYNNSEDLNSKLEIKKVVNNLNSSVGL